jgi:hypothetical protein
MLDGWNHSPRRWRADRIPEAIEAFGKVLAIEPLKAETHLALAKIMESRGRPRGAPATR